MDASHLPVDTKAGLGLHIYFSSKSRCQGNTRGEGPEFEDRTDMIAQGWTQLCAHAL